MRKGRISRHLKLGEPRSTCRSKYFYSNKNMQERFLCRVMIAGMEIILLGFGEVLTRRVSG